MKETFQGSDHHESLVIEATSQRRSSQGEPRDNHNPKRRLNPLLGCRGARALTVAAVVVHQDDLLEQVWRRALDG